MAAKFAVDSQGVKFWGTIHLSQIIYCVQYGAYTWIILHTYCSLLLKLFACALLG